MKDYFSMQYSSIIESQMKGMKDISYFLNKLPMTKEYPPDEYFYAFDNIKGDYTSFGLHRGEFVFNIENKETLKNINEKYDIQNKLFSYYTDMIFHGIIQNDILYIFCVIYTENEFCPGLFETANIVSLLGLKMVPVVLSKTKKDNFLSMQESVVLTQRRGVDFQSKVFILA